MTRRQRCSPRPQVNWAAIGSHRFKDYAIRFCFGAGIALGAALIGMKFGPRVGGVFLGFPAILPASLTLIERKDGKHLAAIDAEGAILGAIALVSFAEFARLTLTSWGTALAVAAALGVWIVVAIGLYALIMAWHHREPNPP